METILHGRSADQIVSQAYVNQRAWTAISVLLPLTLVKLYDEGLFWQRTDARVSATDDYREPRKIALAAFWEVPSLDGVTYRSRHDNGELCQRCSTGFMRQTWNQAAEHCSRSTRLTWRR